MKKTTKDRVSNVAGLILAVSGSLAGVGAAGVHLPPGIISACVLAATVSGAIVAWLTGKPVR